MLTRTSLLAMLAALIAALVLSGCGGGGGTPKQRGGTVSGIITAFDGATSTTQPQGGVTVTLTPVGGGTTYSGITGTDGRFEIRNVPEGPYTVSLTPPALYDLVLPPGYELPIVSVSTGQTSTLPTINMMDAGDVPPDIPAQ